MLLGIVVGDWGFAVNVLYYFFNEIYNVGRDIV
jgi:hypothetical protein